MPRQEVMVGDWVQLPEFGGTKVEVEGEELTVFNGEEIGAKL